jgi:RNA polymerase sigma-70 factor, ECF subfamily
MSDDSRAAESRDPVPRPESAVPEPAEWVDRHGDILFRYAIVRVRDEAAAEDLVQETLLAAMNGARSFRRQSTERTWLIGILRHKVLDHFRRLARERQLWSDAADIVDTGSEFDERGRWSAEVVEWQSPERSLERVEFWQVFDDCVSRLPDKLKTPFALRELDGVESEVLADVLKVSKNNLWVMLSRARKQLRSCLEHRWFER